MSYYKLYSTCYSVNGYDRSIICDTQRGYIFPIPNLLAKLLNEKKGLNIEILKAKTEEKYHSIIDEYFSFLNKNELIFEMNLQKLLKIAEKYGYFLYSFLKNTVDLLFFIIWKEILHKKEIKLNIAK